VTAERTTTPLQLVPYASIPAEDWLAPVARPAVPAWQLVADQHEPSVAAALTLLRQSQSGRALLTELDGFGTTIGLAELAAPQPAGWATLALYHDNQIVLNRRLLADRSPAAVAAIIAHEAAHARWQHAPAGATADRLTVELACSRVEAALWQELGQGQSDPDLERKAAIVALPDEIARELLGRWYGYRDMSVVEREVGG
jgi:Zn-dependent protease with chaperone function